MKNWNRRISYIILAVIIVSISEPLAQESDFVVDPVEIRIEKAESSLGQLVRRSEAIAYVTIVAYQGESSDPAALLALDIEKVLFGKPSATVSTSWDRLAYDPTLPEIGERGILFMTRKRISPDVIVLSSMATIDDFEINDLSRWYIVGGRRGFIHGDLGDVDSIEHAIAGFNRWYRDKTATALEHAHFLSVLLESGNERIREDAVFDLTFFRYSLSVQERDDLLAQPECPSAIRDFFDERRTRAYSSTPMRSREEMEMAFADYDWRENVESGDDELVQRAFQFFSRMTHDERVAYPDLWASAMRSLLNNDNRDIRLRAASALLLINDPAAIPVLIEGLREPEIPLKRVLLRELQRMTDQTFPYDPDASEEIRKAQIAVWDEWWAAETHQKE